MPTRITPCRRSVIRPRRVPIPLRQSHSWPGVRLRYNTSPGIALRQPIRRSRALGQAVGCLSLRLTRGRGALRQTVAGRILLRRRVCALRQAIGRTCGLGTLRETVGRITLWQTTGLLALRQAVGRVTLRKPTGLLALRETVGRITLRQTACRLPLR